MNERPRLLCTEIFLRGFQVIIQLYFRLHKGGHDESGCRFFLKKMPVLIAYNKKKHNNTLDIGKKQVILVHMCFSDKCETIER